MATMKIQSIRGMNDVGLEDSALWRYIEGHAKRVFDSHGFVELRTPVLEATELFKRGVGESTDVVEKEMYTFEDRNGDSLSLRPEGTASVVRAIIQNSWIRDNPVLKLFYIGPMFRHERPQKGRYRQFYQIGAELFGPEGPTADVEIIAAQHMLFTNLGLENVELRLSSIGCDTCRPSYKKLLVELLTPHKADLCEDCNRRLDSNPLRVLDCKVEKCKAIASEMPAIVDHLCGVCKPHFDSVRDGLVALNIPFVVDPKIVRGLDYYNRTAFEFVCTSDKLGAQATISGGGRYDKLVEDLGGKATPAIGFAAGIERIALLLEEQKEKLKPIVDVFLVNPDQEGHTKCLQICNQLRARGVRAEMDLQAKSFKAQMKRANKLNSQYTLIIGKNEIDNNLVILKDMLEGTQEEILFTHLEEELKKRFPKTKNFKL
jgi:histidyl-tRNA synthetase